MSSEQKDKNESSSAVTATTTASSSSAGGAVGGAVSLAVSTTATTTSVSTPVSTPRHQGGAAAATTDEPSIECLQKEIEMLKKRISEERQKLCDKTTAQVAETLDPIQVSRIKIKFNSHS